MKIFKRHSSMSPFSEIRSLVLMRFNARAPHSGQAFVTGGL